MSASKLVSNIQSFVRMSARLLSAVIWPPAELFDTGRALL